MARNPAAQAAPAKQRPDQAEQAADRTEHSADRIDPADQSADQAEISPQAEEPTASDSAGGDESVRDQADAAPEQADAAGDTASETASVLDAVLQAAVRSAASRTAAERAAATKPAAEPVAEPADAEDAELLDAVLQAAVRSAASRTAATKPVAEAAEVTDVPAQDGTAGDTDKAEADAESAQAQDEPADGSEAEAKDAVAGTEAAADAEDAEEGDGAEAAPRAGSRRRAPVVLGVAAAALAAFAVLAAVQAHDLHGQGTTRNAALTDAAATQQVKRQVATAIDTIFSYNYASTASTKAAAQRLLTGKAVSQYDSLFKIVQQQAPAQHLVLTTRVTDIGVELLIGDRARLLVYADQRDTRTAPHQSTSYAGAMFAVNAVRRGGQWRIENIDTFTGGS